MFRPRLTCAMYFKIDKSLLDLAYRIAFLTVAWGVHFAASFAEAQQQEPSTLEKVKETVSEALETKESKYKRELQEADEQRKLEENVRYQAQQLQELEREKQGLSMRPGSYPPPSNVRSSAAVELFVATNCPDCLKTIGFLDALGVSYHLIELDRDTAGEREYLSTIGRGVIPVLRTGNNLVRGYLPTDLRRIVGAMPAFRKGGTAKSEDPGSAAPAEAPPKAQLPPAGSQQFNPADENEFDVSAATQDKQTGPDKQTGTVGTTSQGVREY